MTDLYNSLVNIYGAGKVSTSYKGTYEIAYGNKQIIVPQNLSNDAYVISFTPGAGTIDETARVRDVIRNYFSDSNVDNAILVIGQSAITEQCTEVGYEALQSLGCNTEGAIAMGFSLSAPYSIEHAAEFSKNHPDIPTICLSADGTTATHHQYYNGYTVDAYSGVNPTGTGDNFSVIFVDGQFEHLDQTKRFSESGITSYTITSLKENEVAGSYYYDDGKFVGNCHEIAAFDSMKHVIPFILGKTKAIDCIRGLSLLDRNGNTVDMATLKNVLGADGIINPSSKTTTTSSEEKTAETDPYQSVINKRSELTNLSELKILNMNNNSSNYISSDLQYVCDSMNNIRSIIKNSNSYSNVKKMSISIPDGIFGKISSYINSYMDLVNNLYNKLSLETEAVVSYAQYIVDVDNSLKETDAGKVNTPSKDKGATPVYYPSGGGGGGGIPVTSKTQSFEYNLKDGHKMLVEVDGDKILKITHQYQLDNIDNYDEVVKKIYSAFKNPDVIEKVFLEGNIIHVVLKNNYCSALTLNDINNMIQEV